MAMKSDVRSERRRRIVNRESDRMALITGRVRHLPPSPSPPPSPSSPTSFEIHQHQTHQRIRSHTGISPSFFARDHLKDPDAVSASQIDADSVSKGEISSSIPPKPVARNQEIKGGDKVSIECQIKNPLDRNVSTGEGNSDLQTSPPLQMVQRPSTAEEPEARTRAIRSKLFTSKRVNSCILATQTARAFGSLIIASLVVISYIDFPLLGINIVRSESFVASKPVYILLLTDVTIVVAKLLRERQREDWDEVEEESRVGRKEDEQGGNWDAAVKVLERGLVVYQAIRAIFIDFSVYAVAVICGLSLV